MNGFSICNTLVINKTPFNNYTIDQNMKEKEYEHIDFNFSDFNLTKKSYLPIEKSILIFNNSVEVILL